MIEYVIHAVGYSFLGLIMTSTFVLLSISVYDAVSGCVKREEKKQKVEQPKKESNEQKKDEEKKEEEESKAEIEEIKLITQIVENEAAQESKTNDAPKVIETMNNLGKKTIEISDDDSEESEENLATEQESNAGSDEEKTEENDVASADVQ